MAKKEIFEILENILNAILSEKVEDISLMEGATGTLLFLKNYSYLTHKKDLEDLYESKMEHLINMVNSGKFNSLTYCDGLVGFLSFVHYLSSQWGEETFIIDEEIDEILADKMLYDLSKGDYDFLHSSLGIFFYMANRIKSIKQSNTYRNKLISFLQEALKILEYIALKDCEGYRWQQPMEEFEHFERPFYNMGFAHGQPGILFLLSFAHLLQIDPNSTSRMISESYKFLINHKSLNENDISQFQTYSTPHITQPYDSRLAWCYGDLSISLSLLNVGTTVKSSHILKESFNIAIKTLKRKSIENTRLFDASFCHGTSGVSHMYGILYENYKYGPFKDAQEYWLAKTINYSCFDDGIAGFKSHKEGNSYTIDIGLMKGVSGIGLTLISYLTKNRKWDTFFLLNYGY